MMHVVGIQWTVEGVVDIVNVSRAEEGRAVNIITISRAGEEVVVDIVAVSRAEVEVVVDIVAISRVVEEGYQCIRGGGGSRNRYYCDILCGGGGCRRSSDLGRSRKGIHLYPGRWRKEQRYTLSASRVAEEDRIANATEASKGAEGGGVGGGYHCRIQGRGGRIGGRHC